MKKGRITALLLVGVLLLTGCSGTKQPSAYSGSGDESEFHISDITPATDFFGYVNAEELMDLQIKPGENGAGVYEVMSSNIKEDVEGLIDEIVASKKDYPKGSNEQLIRDYYNQSVAYSNGDEKADKADEEFIAGLIESVNQVSDMDELIELWCELDMKYGIEPPLYSIVRQDIYDTDRLVVMVTEQLPSGLEDVSSSDITAGIERDALKATLILSGLDEPVARERATEIIYMLSEIAGKCEFVDEDEEDKDKTKAFVYYSKEEVSSRLTNITYEQLCAILGFKGNIPQELAIPDITRIAAIEETFDNAHLQQWKDSTLTAILVDPANAFPAKYTQNKPNPAKADKVAKYNVRHSLEKVIAEVYSERYENPKKVELSNRICDDLVKEYARLIDEADWMSAEGKAYCRKKLDNMEFFIGSGEPREVQEEDGDLIGETFLRTSQNLLCYQRKQNLDSYFKPVDRSGYAVMSSITVNACYVPTLNSIVIPDAYMDDEVLNLSKSYEWNLGGMGSTIGHEISHAFDSYGIKFDYRGNYVPEQMPKEDRDAFKELQDKAVEYYSGFTFLGSHINGKNTLGENFADISGLQACLEIAGTPDKQKEVFEAYAHSYCELGTDELLKGSMETDVHSPDFVRVNAVVPIFDCFYDIYDVKEGDPMYVAPENRIRRW